ncbi:SGNH/GDSL hydrolase family protein [uncultured Massilia sp.]|uniref:SGNH/GDSL hydrolase family protein n=1 Tax=uncultured Massilia sp. TaxID=169973 RepID=UPI0025F322CD|nr:SGNH/GDSL hydrolase family protein [uncultured Massilia sp.]
MATGQAGGNHVVRDVVHDTVRDVVRDRERPRRRTFLRQGAALAGALGAAVLCPPFRGAAAATREAWCATWGTAPAGPPPSASTLGFADQTLRLVVRASIGGSRVRVRLSNEMGSAPLRIGAAGIGVRASGANLVAGSARALTFNGRAGVAIPAGSPAVSDPVDLAFPAQADLAISLYLPGTVAATTTHDLALQTGYVSSTGNHVTTPALPVARSIASWPFLGEVDVAGAGGTIVAFGDSLTDGARSTGNANRRWPDWLARRLLAESLPGSAIPGVVNRGISGNSLLNDYANAWLAGHDGLERFDRDVLATAGVRWLVVLIGINDICYSPSSDPIPPEDITGGYLQLIARARARGVDAIGATLPPFEGHVYYTAARESVRQHVNAWIRNAGAWDAVVDVERALRDPSRPARLLPAYDSGDHLHPSDAGYAAMAQAVPLGIFG